MDEMTVAGKIMRAFRPGDVVVVESGEQMQPETWLNHIKKILQDAEAATGVKFVLLPPGLKVAPPVVYVTKDKS